MRASLRMSAVVVNVRSEPCDVYIGRAVPRRRLPRSKWANPFRIGPDGTREQVIQKYRTYLQTRHDLLQSLPVLANARLGCWCAPDPCHGDVLVELLGRGSQT